MPDIDPSTLPEFFTHDEQALARLVSLVDPSLVYVRDLHPSASTCRSLQVEHDGTPGTLKVRQVSDSFWEDTYFQLEIFALKRARERNLTCVTHLVHHYRGKFYEAILKTFVAGTPGDQLDTEELLSSRAFIDKLDDLFMQLHLAGIAKINFQPRKVVIDNDGNVTLVDMSTCIVNTQHGIGGFVQEMRNDSRFISRLERNAMFA